MNELRSSNEPAKSAAFRSIAREVGADEELVVDLAARLQPVRGRISDDSFADLVREITRTKLRFAQRDAAIDLAAARGRSLDD